MADQEFWRQEQARADAARIKRAQGRDGTWVSSNVMFQNLNMDFSDANGIAKKIIPMSVIHFQDRAVAVTSRETSFVAETVVVIKCPDDMIVVVVPHLVADMAVVVVEAAVVVIKKAMDCHVMVVAVVVE